MTMYCPYCVRPTDGSRCPHCNKNIDSADNGLNLPVGTLLDGKYRVGRVLGQGGFGVTYIARDTVLDMIVAIKECLPAQYACRKEESLELCARNDQADAQNIFNRYKKKFREEGKNLAKLMSMGHVVDVFNYFEANSTEYIVMEYLDGPSLAEIIKNPKYGPFTMPQLERLVKPLMQDLAEMHRTTSLLHRDITPANIKVSRGELKIYDFGSARRMEGNKTMSILVTEGYAPLEQFSSGSQQAYTDVYSMAGTIFTCLTGKVPQGAISRVFKDEMVFPRELGVDITERQNNALKKAMALRYRDRTQTMDEFVEALFGEEVEPQPQPQPQPQPGRMELLKKVIAEKKRLILGGAAAICVLAMVGVGIGQLVKAQPETEPEDIEVVAPAEVSPEASPVIQVDKVRMDTGGVKEMKVGDTATFSASVDPDNADDQTITWSSSDPSVLSVAEDGTVEALAPGYATITARASNGKFVKRSITVWGYAEFEGIYASELSMSVGDFYRSYKTVSDSSFEYSFEKVYPYSNMGMEDNPWIEFEEVTWSSGKESVVTVDQNGSVTAVGEGTAIITATAANGKQDSCQVTVTAATPEPTPLTISGQTSSDDDYIIPHSDTKRLTEADLKDLTWKELGLARNEIYARYGYDFSNEELADYFNSKSWYKGTTTDVEAVRAKFNEVERDNADLIRTYEIDTYGSTYAFGKN